MSEGTIVVGDLAIPVAKVALRDGMVELTAELHGPVDLPTEGTARLHSPDGKLVVAMPWIASGAEVEAARSAAPHGRVTVIVPLQITTGGS